MNSIILFALLCTGAFASVQPVLDFLNFCPLLDCSFIRCPNGNLLKRSKFTLNNGLNCPGCPNTCVDPLLIKRNVLPFQLCPMIKCAMPSCDRSQWIDTKIDFNGLSCGGCPTCAIV